MNGDLKRLIKYDLFVLQRVLAAIVGVSALLWGWFYLLLGNSINVMFLFMATICMVILNLSVMDWQNGANHYISMSISRKNVFAAMIYRFAAIVVEGLIISIPLAFLSGIQYFQPNIIVFYIGTMLLNWGWAQFAGMLVYHKKVIGTIMHVIGLVGFGMVTGMLCVLGKEGDYYSKAVEWIHMEYALILLAVAILVSIGAFFTAKRQIANFAVYS